MIVVFYMRLIDVLKVCCPKLRHIFNLLKIVNPTKNTYDFYLRCLIDPCRNPNDFHRTRYLF